MKIGVLIAASVIALSSANVYALDTHSCNMYMDYYHKYLDKYNQDAKKHAPSHDKKVDSDMAKNYQDKLLEGCKGVIDLREVENNKYMIDTAYKIYH